MKNIFIKKLMVLTIATTTFLGFGSITAHAEWKQSENGQWWNSEGNSSSTGWRDINSKWYYFNPNGYMKTGWISDNGKWYYLKDDGSMAINETVNGYKVDNNGVWIQNTTVNSNNTNTVNNINSNNTTNTNVTNNVNNGIVINGNVNIGNTTNTNTTIQQNNNIPSTQTSVPTTDSNDQINSLYPCWTILNGKYYHINKNKEIDYDKTVDGFIIGSDGAWEQDNSIKPPKAVEVPYAYKLQALQVIQKLQHEAKLDEIKSESKEEKHQYRMGQIKELQDKIDNIKKHNYNNGQEMLQKYENKIKALEIEDENDYK